MSISDQLHLRPGDSWYNRWEHLTALADQLSCWQFDKKKYPFLLDLYLHELSGEGGVERDYGDFRYGHFLKEGYKKYQFPDASEWETLNEHSQIEYFSRLMASFHLAIFVENTKNGFPDHGLRQAQ